MCRNESIININNIVSYQKSDLIGNGSFSLVFKGIYLKTKQIVAIKQIKLTRLDTKSNEDFSEVNILKNFLHSNIVSFYDYFIYDNTLIIVTEYCDGGDLMVYLEKHKCFNSSNIKILIRQISSAIFFLHSNGIIHRDIKLQNILLSKHKEKNSQEFPYTFKLGDFGFARILTQNSMAFTFCGSPLYMAPEVITKQEYDFKADIWSFGIVIYVCLFNCFPLNVTSSSELVKLYDGALKFSFPTEDELLADLLKKLITIDPNERIDHVDLSNHTYLKQSTPESSLIIEISNSNSNHQSEASFASEDKAKSDYDKNTTSTTLFKDIDTYFNIAEQIASVTNSRIDGIAGIPSLPSYPDKINELNGLGCFNIASIEERISILNIFHASPFYEYQYERDVITLPICDLITKRFENLKTELLTLLSHFIYQMNEYLENELKILYFFNALMLLSYIRLLEDHSYISISKDELQILKGYTKTLCQNDNDADTISQLTPISISLHQKFFTNTLIWINQNIDFNTNILCKTLASFLYKQYSHCVDKTSKHRLFLFLLEIEDSL